MKILKSKTQGLYLEKMEVGRKGEHLAVLTDSKRDAMQFDSDLQIGHFLGVCGFELDHFEIVEV